MALLYTQQIHKDTPYFLAIAIKSLLIISIHWHMFNHALQVQKFISIEQNKFDKSSLNLLVPDIVFSLTVLIFLFLNFCLKLK